MVIASEREAVFFTLSGSLLCFTSTVVISETVHGFDGLDAAHVGLLFLPPIDVSEDVSFGVTTVGSEDGRNVIDRRRAPSSGRLLSPTLQLRNVIATRGGTFDDRCMCIRQGVTKHAKILVDMLHAQPLLDVHEGMEGNR